MPSRCMIRGSKNLGVELHNWHESSSDPIYEVGSQWYAGHAAPCDSVKRALSNLKRLKLDPMWRPREKRSLDICIRALKASLRRKGID